MSSLSDTTLSFEKSQSNQYQGRARESEHRSGVTTQEMMTKIQKMALDDRRLKVRALVDKVGISESAKHRM